jgi:hypothetical protein
MALLDPRRSDALVRVAGYGRDAVVGGLAVLVLASACGTTVAASQDLIGLARPQVSGRSGLRSALENAVRSRGMDTEAALLASWGDFVTRDAVSIAADESEDRDVRIAAIRVLGYARPRAAITTLQRLAQPDPRGDILWFEAMAALARFPYPELAEYWRSLLNHAVPDVRMQAVFGLSWTGVADDTLLMDGVRVPRRDSERAIARLRVPRSNRSSHVFADPMAEDGRFVPTAEWLDRARPYLCSSRRLPC